MIRLRRLGELRVYRLIAISPEERLARNSDEKVSITLPLPGTQRALINHLCPDPHGLDRFGMPICQLTLPGNLSHLTAFRFELLQVPPLMRNSLLLQQHYRGSSSPSGI